MNHDGAVTPADVVVIVNHLMAVAANQPVDVGQYTPDTNQDGEVTPLDALVVINSLIESASGGAEHSAYKVNSGEDESEVLDRALAESESWLF